MYPGPPTDWSNLYTSLNIVQGINAAVFPGQKTIVSLDLQLYVKCMQLREKDNISKHFVFRLGELHIVFAMLKVIGKYIDESGLDRLFVESGIYGPTTLAQIKDGKHMKRGFEAFMILYLSLTHMYVNDVNESFSDDDNLTAMKIKMEEIAKKTDYLQRAIQDTYYLSKRK